ncbi:LuxR C-terminal-related transcriptional regulator [Methylocapsa sp. S129]|uniref:helix-turn-helix transcriptional regulator n=1 Tax=Methylocapsa sp. S129 TaxID=1641869 RepID=UPI00131AB88B|nr:LuxR C-terminal-related transcriptional regulator [Methylocapsa sp. S129]
MTLRENELIDLLYESVIDAGRWRHALDEFRKYFGSFAAFPELAEAVEGRVDAACASFDRPESEANAMGAETLAQHVVRASRLRESFERLQAEALGLAAVADRLSAGVIVLDGQGQSLYINDAARKFIARKDGLTLDRGGRLRAVKRAADRALALLQDKALEEGPGGLAQVPREGDMRPYAIMVAPLPASSGGLGASGESRAGILMLIHDPDSAEKLSARVLAEIFGLTPKTAELVAALAVGEELKDYADRAGLSLHTVRFHLKSTFLRMGVRSQAQLVRLAVRAAADLHF